MAERETTTNGEQNDKDLEQQGTGENAAPETPINPNESPEDPDFAALKAAEAEVAKGAGEKGKAEGEGKQPAAEQPKAEPEPRADARPAEAPVGEGEKKMVPVDALHAARRQTQEWRDRAANLQGQLEALQSFVPKPAPGPATQEKTPAERIADLEAALIASGEKFDSGEIGMAELLKEQTRIQGEIWNLRRDTIQVATPGKKDEPAPHVDLYREEKLTAIEKDHPYVGLITEDRHWNFLRDEAVAQLEQRGITLDPKNPQHDLLFRQTMADLTDVYGPQWTGKTRDQLGVKPSQSDQPKGSKPNGAPPPSPAAKARASKLELAGNLPPDVSALGGAGDGNDVWTPERVESLTDEEYEALPPATRAAIDRRFGLSPPT